MQRRLEDDITDGGVARGGTVVTPLTCHLFVFSRVGQQLITSTETTTTAKNRRSQFDRERKHKMIIY